MENPGRSACPHFDALIEAAGAWEPVPAAIVHPCDEPSLRGAVEAARGNLIRPILVGPRQRIRRVAEQTGIVIDDFQLEDTAHSHASAARAVALARAGAVGMLVKGALHTDELISEVLDRGSGLRTERRLSHVFALDVPTYAKLLFLTDGAINIAPDLQDKRDIVQNAIDLARAAGIGTPRVAILSAVETVNPRIASTVDAAALCKMADRGQISGGLMDGPLAFDNAVSADAAAIKGIHSRVAGDADILVVPDLMSGNMLAKQLVYLAAAKSSGIALGARVPIALTSRSDGVLSRVVSCALARSSMRNRTFDVS
ncbi:MAG TPA: bifunctional enoyl-CoA hydratase/phosphate acetyltransferase [Rhodanobacteraceae bacterium]|nr:bifunctional enoyl-CoA hydratase/phosphate acetyltransferase [Rhodanobacteraceae bacterium]